MGYVAHISDPYTRTKKTLARCQLLTPPNHGLTMARPATLKTITKTAVKAKAVKAAPAKAVKAKTVKSKSKG